MSFLETGVELRPRARARRSQGAGVWVRPLLVVGLVLALAVGGRILANGGNVTGLIHFGSAFAGALHPPPGAIIDSASGYDGQFLYVQALDPLLLHNSTVHALAAAGQPFRAQRLAYPALAFLLSAGQPGAIPYALLAVNLLVLLGLAAAFAAYAAPRDWSPWWAAALALMPGMLLASTLDLSDPLALSAMVAGMLLWRDGKRWPATVALVLAVLAREVMMLAVLAIAWETGLGAWRARGGSGEGRRILARAWPVIAVPTGAFATWQIYIAARFGGPVGGAGLSAPLWNLVTEVRSAFQAGPPLMAVWDAAYVLLILAGSVAAFMLLRRRVTLFSAAACCLALGVLVPTLGNPLSDTRLSAPLFSLLLIEGLQRRDRATVRIAAAAAAMSFLVPFAIPGSF
jgi:hypothetical protein